MAQQHQGDSSVIDTLIHGDALDVLKTLESNSIDSCVVDPPYGLGEVKDIAGLLQAWLHDEDDKPHLGKSGFMNATWDAGVPGPRYWREVLRVMKPGAHILCFASTRTVDLMMIALRLAGFQCKDTLMWVYGSGFPKSTNISKQIDRMKGAEREVVGTYDSRSAYDGQSRLSSGSAGMFDNSYGVTPITAPSTPEARQHAGTGTALKPSHEPIILARKPLSEKTIAENVLKWGTGGLAIDQCRVGTQAYTQEQWTQKGLSRVTGNSYGEHKGSDTPVPQGRFPANLLMSHSVFCVPLGARKVKGNAPQGRPSLGSPMPNGFLTGGKMIAGCYADSDGMEEVQAWECHKGGIVTLPSYEYGNAALSPLSELSYLLDQLQSLLEVLHNCSKNDNIRLNSEDAPSHIACISQVDFSGGLAHDLDDAENHLHELAHALGVSQFVGSLCDCLSCLHLCDGYVHRLVTAYQDGLPSLADALSDVHHWLVELEYNQNYQFGESYNEDDAHLHDKPLHTVESRTGVSRHSSEKSETSSHIQGTLFEALQPASLLDSTNGNNTYDSEHYEKCAGKRCKSDLVRLLIFLSFDILSHVLPIDIIQQKAIDINTSPCPIRLLDEQSGIRKSGLKTQEHADHRNGMFSLPSGNACYSEQAGGASRYFAQFQPTPEDYAPFLYCSKASRAERSKGCEGLPERIDRNYAGGPLNRPEHQSSDGVQRTGERQPRTNSHPCVKPLQLLNYLITMITPTGGTVLDCFAGSGSTLVACVQSGFNFIGIEQDSSYCSIAEARIAYARKAVV